MRITNRIIYRKIFIVGVMKICFVGPVFADECAAAKDQATLTRCAQNSLNAADAELNKQYKEILKRLDEVRDVRAMFVKAEKAWINYRDVECGFRVSGMGGASMSPMIEAGCKEELTRNRLNDFSIYLKCDEYDTICPVPAAN